jgi:RNA polymerase sigma factor (sigma-70 family)
MADDSELLHRFLAERSEDAFAELVGRHLNLVYLAALRQVNGDAHCAEDVTQCVFAKLAVKARSLDRRSSLAGWLYLTTRFEAAHAVRTEQRRRARELEAQTMHDILMDSEPAADWNRLRSVIDEILCALNPQEREVVLLRFFQGTPFAELGARIGITADAARFKLDRTLEKIRVGLAKRGIKSTSAALAVALAAQAEMTVPAGLAATVTTSAVASALGAEASVFGLWRLLGGIKAIFSLSGALWVGGLLSLPAAGTALHEIRENQQAQAQLAATNAEIQAAVPKLRTLVRQARSAAQARARPSAAEHTAEWDSRAEARKFLHTYPEARGLFMQVSTTDAFYSFAGFLRRSNLTPEQIEQFESLIAANWMGNLVATPGKAAPGVLGVNFGPGVIAAGGGDPTFEELREVLGDAGARDFQAYEQTLQYPYKFVTGVAGDASEAGAPLTGSQVDQLAQIIASNTGPHHTDPIGLNSGNWEAARDAVDWNTAIAQAKAALPPGQFSIVQGKLLALQYRAALDEARQGQNDPAVDP